MADIPHLEYQRLYNGVRIVDRPCLPNVRRLDEGALQMVWAYHRNGMLVDQAHFKALGNRLRKKISSLAKQIENLVGPINYNSGDQLAELLFHRLKLRVKSPSGGEGEPRLTKGGKREQLNDEVLAALKDQHQIVPMLVEARSLDKLLGSFVDKLPRMVGSDGRIRTEIRHTVAETGRLASSNPNLQQLPVRTEEGMEVRNGFVAGRDCKLISIDLSQVEMLMAGVLAHDEILLQAFLDNTDIHTLTACTCFKLDRGKYLGLSRKAQMEEDGADPMWRPGEKDEWKKFKKEKRLPSKTIGFGLLYGQTALGAQANIIAQGGPWLPEEEVDAIIRGWFQLYRGVEDWVAIQHYRAHRYGMVWDMFGRTRLIPEARSKVGRIMREGLRQAGNMPIQSSAGGLLKLAMAELMPIVEGYQRHLGIRCWPLIAIHDELVFEVSDGIVDEFAHRAHEVMTHVAKLPVPLRASWSSAERFGDLK